MIQKLLEMRNIFRRIHITINIRLTPHNIRLFVCKETFNRYIEFILLIRLKVIKHDVESLTFIRLLTRLYNNVNKSLTNNINEAIKMHMVITFIINKVRFIKIFDNFGICCVNNMTTITSQDAMAFKSISSGRKG